VIKRTVDGRSVRYVERFATRRVIDVIDSIFMDSAISYDGRNTGSTTMTLSGGTTWEYNETLTLTASSAFFTASDVGNAIQLTGPNGELIRFTIEAFTSSTVVTGKPNRTVPVSLRSAARTTWAKAVDVLGGLWHLEGKDVSVFADSFVESSPYNASYVTRTVVDGQVQLSQPYAVIHVGLPFISDAETLDVDTAQGETISNKRIQVSKVTASVEKTRGLFCGAMPPNGSDPLDGLQEFKLRESETNDEPVALLTGKGDVVIEPMWNNNGRVFLRQVDPLPMSILSITGEGLFPFKGGN